MLFKENTFETKVERHFPEVLRKTSQNAKVFVTPSQVESKQHEGNEEDNTKYFDLTSFALSRRKHSGNESRWEQTRLKFEHVQTASKRLLCSIKCLRPLIVQTFNIVKKS